MDAVHLHLILTHIPIVGSFFVAALFFWAAFRKDSHIGRFTLYIGALVSLTAIPVYLAGMAAEEKIEHLSWVSENLIDTHETIATVALVFSLFVTVVSIVIIIFNRKSDTLKTSIFWGMFLLVFLQFAIFSFTGNRGGLIGHPEIRSSGTNKGYIDKGYYTVPTERRYHREDD